MVIGLSLRCLPYRHGSPRNYGVFTAPLPAPSVISRTLDYNSGRVTESSYIGRLAFYIPAFISFVVGSGLSALFAHMAIFASILAMPYYPFDLPSIYVGVMRIVLIQLIFLMIPAWCLTCFSGAGLRNATKYNVDCRAGRRYAGVHFPRDNRKISTATPVLSTCTSLLSLCVYPMAVSFLVFRQIQRGHPSV